MCCKNSLNSKIIKKIDNFINIQIDENSVHKSYNILEHAKLLNNLIEIRNIFLFFKVETSQNFNKNILAMTSVLKTYQHADKSLPLFNGCNNNYNKTKMESNETLDRNHKLPHKYNSNNMNNLNKHNNKHPFHKNGLHIIHKINHKLNLINQHHKLNLKKRKSK